MIVTKRIEALRATFAEAGIDGLYVTGPTNRRYMSGFTGSAGSLLITQDEALIITDFRYFEQAEQQATAYTLVDQAKLKPRLARYAGEKIGFEKDIVSVAGLEEMEASFGGAEGVKWTPVAGLVETLRGEKDDAELATMQKAIDIADACFDYIIGEMKPGVTEEQIAWKMEVFMRENGADALSFPSIVASGVNGALPHARPSDKPLAAGEFVTLDFGCVYEGYCSDMTRTVFLGEPTGKDEEMYGLVLKAQKAGVAAVRPGVRADEVDAVARDIIAAAGYGENFGHGLGHGIGMDVHEEIPRLSPVGRVVLAPRMVASVEPGVYVPGWGGIRIEDLVVVTEDGCRILTHSPKELITLPA